MLSYSLRTPFARVGSSSALGVTASALHRQQSLLCQHVTGSQAMPLARPSLSGRALSARLHAVCALRKRQLAQMTPSAALWESRRYQATSSSASGEGHGVTGAQPYHEDLYCRLGLTRGCDKKDIKTNYRKLAKFYHPDYNAGNKEAEEAFKRVTEAYETLSDADRRRMYDTTGRTNGAGTQSSGFQGFSYSYSAHMAKHNPVRFYLGVAAMTWFLVALAKWGVAGTLIANVLTFCTMLTVVTFTGRLVSAVLLFILYAPSRQGTPRDGLLSPNATVAMTSHAAPNPHIRPTRTIRLTGIRGSETERSKRSVEFSLHFAGAPEPEGVKVRTKVGEFHAMIPADVPDVPLVIDANLVQEGVSLWKQVVDLR